MPSAYKLTEFYRKYGVSMAEMGRKVGVSKEAIRLRVKRGTNVTKMGNQSLNQTKKSHRI
jgi:predicted DNA-binding protein YlxM (UPF0122 family)